MGAYFLSLELLGIELNRLYNVIAKSLEPVGMAGGALIDQTVVGDCEEAVGLRLANFEENSDEVICCQR